MKYEISKKTSSNFGDVRLIQIPQGVEIIMGEITITPNGALVPLGVKVPIIDMIRGSAVWHTLIDGGLIPYTCPVCGRVCADSICAICADAGWVIEKDNIIPFNNLRSGLLNGKSHCWVCGNHSLSALCYKCQDDGWVAEKHPAFSSKTSHTITKQENSKKVVIK
jgi:hypothetical protein